jgi:hypothetical protein
VAAWGDNDSGQCNVPAGLTNVFRLATGIGGGTGSGANNTTHDYADSLALKTDGTLVKWVSVLGILSPTGSNYVAMTGNAATPGVSGADGNFPYDDWAIYGAPQIITPPPSQTVCLGSLVSLPIGVAPGSPVRSYQWRKNGANLTNGGNISGATNALLSFAAFGTNDVGSYTVVLQNDGGSVTSAPASLTVAASCTVPAITQQPANQSLAVGTTAAFAVTANGPGPLNYQWRKNGNTLFNGGNISGAISPTLTIAALSLSDRANYDVVVSNPAGAVTSSLASLWVNQPGVDTDGDGLPDTIDAAVATPDTTAPVFTLTAPTENATY